METLTFEILQARTGAASLEHLVQKTALTVYEMLTKRWKIAQEDAHEFLIRFYSQIPRLIQRFRYQGKPFEAFLTACLKRHYYRFLTRRNRLESLLDRSHVAFQEEDPELAQDQTIVELASDTRRQPIALRPALLHASVLRLAWYLDDCQLTRAAESLNLPVEVLRQQVERLRAHLWPKAQRRQELLKLRGEYVRLLIDAQNRLRLGSQPEAEQRLRDRQSRLKARLESLDKRIAKISLLPPLRLIGMVLGKSKAAVHRLSHKLRGQVALCN